MSAAHPQSLVGFYCGSRCIYSKNSFPNQHLSKNLLIYFFFLGRIFFSSDLSRRSTFLTSSPGGNVSGRIPRSSNMLRTAQLLFFRCADTAFHHGRIKAEQRSVAFGANNCESF